MSSSNYRRNKASIDRFRKELKAMMGDICSIDKRVLNRAVNEGVAYAKRNTPVGEHPNPVTFTTKKIGNGIEAELINSADYSSFWNYGHRIVTKKGGPTKGFVKGTFLLEKTKGRVQKQMVKEFDKEVKAVQKRHD